MAHIMMKYNTSKKPDNLWNALKEHIGDLRDMASRDMHYSDIPVLDKEIAEHQHEVLDNLLVDIEYLERLDKHFKQKEADSE